MLEVNTRPKSKPLFDQIRSHILEGEFSPGQWLKQAELESAYGATRSDVRAALSTLADRGIVEHIPNQGFRVHNRSPQEIQEMVEIIVALERTNAKSVAENVTDEDIENLKILAEQFQQLMDRGEHSDLRLVNYQYHSYLNNIGHNRTMSQTIQRLRECCITKPFGRYTTYSGLQESNREHFEMIKLLKVRDAEKLSAILGRHSSHTD